MNYLLYSVFCFLVVCCSFQSAYGAPLLNATEFVLESNAPNHCFLKVLNCSKRKISASLQFQNTGRLKTTGVFKLSGEDSKLGGQVWFQANENFWLGLETLSDLDFDLEGELYVAGVFEVKKITLIPFVAISMKNETLGGLGGFVYFNKSIKIGLEYRVPSDLVGENHWVTSLGFRTDTGIFKDLWVGLGKKIEETIPLKEIK